MKHSIIALAMSTGLGLLIFSAGTALGQAQVYPAAQTYASANPGQCYASVYTPARYETATRYEITKEAYTTYEYSPATYETVYEKVLIKEGYHHIQITPPTFKYVVEKIKVSHGRYVWKPRDSCKNCVEVKDDYGKVVTRIEKSTGALLCLVEEPPQYKKIRRYVVDKPADTTQVWIPPKYQTFVRHELKQPSEIRYVDIPAEYEAVSYRALVYEGSVSLEPVLCDGQVTTVTLKEIQKALHHAGLYDGSIDGYYGPQTKNAIVAYQKAMGMKQGHYMTLETLAALNVGNY